MQRTSCIGCGAAIQTQKIREKLGARLSQPEKGLAWSKPIAASFRSRQYNETATFSWRMMTTSFHEARDGDALSSMLSWYFDQMARSSPVCLKPLSQQEMMFSLVGKSDILPKFVKDARWPNG